MGEDINELKRLLYSNRLTQYGKRKLIKYYEYRIQDLENKLQDIIAYILINGVDKPLRTATQIKIENEHEYIIQQKINSLKKRIQELEEEIADREKSHMNLYNGFKDYKRNSIPTSVIEEKIEEVENEYKKIHAQHYRNCRTLEEILKAKKEVLEEILEEGRK